MLILERSQSLRLANIALLSREELDSEFAPVFCRPRFRPVETEDRPRRASIVDWMLLEAPLRDTPLSATLTTYKLTRYTK